VATWGGITGTLSDQTDLQTALNAKQNTLTAGDAITITGDTISADIVPADFFTAGDNVIGTGSTLTLNKTIEAPIQSVEIDGDTTQQTYSGKNLIDYLGVTYSERGASYTVDGNVIAFSKYEEGTYKYCVLLLSLDDSQKLYGKTVTLSYDKASSINGVSCGIRVFWCNPNSLAVSNALNNGFTQTSGHIVDTFSIQSTPPDASQPQIALCIYPDITNAPVASSSTMSISNLQLEIGSSATTYEPYVGGIPSPNPSYPQNVNVVTGEQTVQVSGKNLCYDIQRRTNNSIQFFFPKALSSSTITISTALNVATATNTISLWVDSNNIGNVGTFSGNAGETISRTFTFTGSQMSAIQSGSEVFLQLYKSNAGFTLPTWAQIELGSTATAYEPYQSQSYTVNLGSIELCKLGNYQDYIYKSGSDWYVHKETNKILLDGSTETWYGSVFNNKVRAQLNVRDIKIISSNSDFVGVSDHFYKDISVFGAGINDGMFCQFHDTNQVYWCAPSSCTTLPEFRNWLSNNNTLFYYVLATPTDTKITDSTLVGQLNALAAGTSYLDVTNFAVAATGTNLPAILDVSVFRKSLAGMLAADQDVNDATLTIQKNGATVATFTANSSTATTANITVPTKVSDLTNDAGYTTNTGTITAVQANGTSVATSGTANIPAATTSAYGVTQLSSSTSSTSTSLAATPSAVKSAYDLASGKATITMTTTDPGEGSPLAANSFIAVYEA
jgi:hypothetical protein